MKIHLSVVERKDALIYSICLHQNFLQRRTSDCSHAAVVFAAISCDPGFRRRGLAVLEVAEAACRRQRLIHPLAFRESNFGQFLSGFIGGKSFGRSG
jgi:hypothetical protein